ncbi:MAG: ATP-binding protein, partial [Ilumatobacteraceae bacterium]
MAESEAARRHYQKLVDSIDADLDARVDLEPWLDAACVLEAFDPDRLRPVGGVATHRDVETLAQEALLERCQLLTDGPLAGLWQLTPLHRVAALERLWSRAGVAEALAANPERPDTALQQMFERVVAHEVDRQPLTREELVGLLGAHEWLDQFADIEPSRREVEKALAQLDQLAPLRRLVGEGFVGREPELAQIAAYVDLHRPPVPLFVHAPGGVGKSTLLAQYALTSSSRHPTCYIDLDRPTMSPTQPLTILVEAARQLAGLVAVDPAALAVLVNEVSSAASRLDGGRQYESSTAYGDDRPQLIGRFVDVFREPLDASPVVVVVDTFEEAEVLGREVVRVLLDFVALWASAHRSLRFVLAGRTLPPDFVTDVRSAFADELGSGTDEGVDMIPMPLRPIDLGEFDQPTARLFLTRAVTEAGGALTTSEADELLGIVGRSPMCLRLAARLVQAEGLEELRRHRSEFLARLRSEKVQALLYGRILRQLHDDEVRKLALPGLIVRRITVDVIREVLAGPCGLTIGPDRDAQALFDALAREAALVQIDTTDGCARHRSDVRRVMLVDLADEIDEHVVRRIDEAAVAYYSRFDDAVS